MPRLPDTNLDVFGLCLGANVFGWTIDEPRSFAVLDAYAAAGGNFIDTADVYSAFAPGNRGGESETIIGAWMAARGNRDQMVIATKVGMLEGARGLSRHSIFTAVDASLRRLQTDRIDLYYAHRDDPEVEQEETLSAFDALVRDGRAVHIAASNFSAARLSSALEISAHQGLASYVALQPQYNLLDRDSYEGSLAEVCERHGVACLPYYGLASGFLTGKYRQGAPEVDSARAAGVRERYMNERGFGMLRALDEVAGAHHVSVAAVALAWLLAQPTVAAPIASATSVEQLEQLLDGAALVLEPQEIASLSAAGA